MDPPVAQRLTDGRLHLSHGPIDLVLRAWGAKMGARTHVYPGAKIWAPWQLTLADDACIGDGADMGVHAKNFLQHNDGAARLDGRLGHVGLAFEAVCRFQNNQMSHGDCSCEVEDAQAPAPLNLKTAVPARQFGIQRTSCASCKPKASNT